MTTARRTYSGVLVIEYGILKFALQLHTLKQIFRFCEIKVINAVPNKWLRKFYHFIKLNFIGPINGSCIDDIYFYNKNR